MLDEVTQQPGGIDYLRRRPVDRATGWVEVQAQHGRVAFGHNVVGEAGGDPKGARAGQHPDGVSDPHREHAARCPCQLVGGMVMAGET